MPNLVARPEHLPLFRAPPLKEVVLGIQFSPPKGYQQIYAGSVWDLFRGEYPNVEEKLPLGPVFETFGLPHQATPGPQFSFGIGTSHDRFWFLRPDGEELIQFQQDRLLHNWRKVGNGTNEYPHFEAMLARFRAEIHSLQTYLAFLAPQTLQINQCEITYVNQIGIKGEGELVASDWLRSLNFHGRVPDDFSMTLRESFVTFLGVL